MTMWRPETNVNGNGVVSEYGIVANVTETDRIFRLGAKAWLSGGTGGNGWDEFKWIATSRGGRIIEKWAPTWRFANFRAAWIPEHLRERVDFHMLGIPGTREEMEACAAEISAFADELRTKHPHRRV